MPPVTTAVVPVAGLGTRLRPATRALPKEMLPVGGRPVVQHVVEELAANGIEHVVFVTASGKEAIEDHFVGDDTGVTFASTIQPDPRGLGDAVLHADGFTGGGPFAVALGDAILGTREHPPVVRRLGRARDEHDAVCAIAVREVPRASTGPLRDRGHRRPPGHDVARVTKIVEKPAPETAPSTLAVAARYVMTPAIFPALRATPIGATGELELTDALARLVRPRPRPPRDLHRLGRRNHRHRPRPRGGPAPRRPPRSAGSSAPARARHRLSSRERASTAVSGLSENTPSTPRR